MDYMHTPVGFQDVDQTHGHNHGVKAQVCSAYQTP